MRYSDNDLRATYGRTLVELGEKYPNVVVLDADLHTSTMSSLFRERFPRRFFQCGIAEANMFGMAAGLADRGFVVFPSTFAAFAVRRGLDSIYMHTCMHRANVKIPGSYPGLTATECGGSHNCCEDLGVMAALPGMRVADAGDDRELASLMHAAVETPGPVYFRVPKARLPVLFGEDYRFEWGRGHVLAEGGDLSILSTGMMTGVALAAAELLAKDGIAARVVHMPSVKPLDEELVARCARETGLLLTVENGRVGAGFGSIVAEAASRLCPVRVEQVGVERERFAASDNLYNLLHHHRMTPRDIADRARMILGR